MVLYVNKTIAIQHIKIGVLKKSIPVVRSIKLHTTVNNVVKQYILELILG